MGSWGHLVQRQGTLVKWLRPKKGMACDPVVPVCHQSLLPYLLLYLKHYDKHEVQVGFRDGVSTHTCAL